LTPDERGIIEKNGHAQGSRSACDSGCRPFSTEDAYGDKVETTVALDYSATELDDGELLHAYGVPGQRYLDFMWPMVCEGAPGLIVLVSARPPDPIASTVERLQEFSRIAPQASLAAGITRTDEHPELLNAGSRLPVMRVDARSATELTFLLKSLLSYRFVETHEAARARLTIAGTLLRRGRRSTHRRTALRCAGVQLHAEGARHLEDGREIRTTFARQRAIQAFTGHAGVAGNLAHSLRTGNIAERLGDECRIAVAFGDARVQIRGHFFGGTKMLRDIESAQCGFLLGTHVSSPCPSRSQAP